MQLVYLRMLSVCGHACALKKKKNHSPSHSELSSTQKHITERKRWHVGVAKDSWPQFSASISRPDRAVNGPHS